MQGYLQQNLTKLQLSNYLSQESVDDINNELISFTNAVLHKFSDPILEVLDKTEWYLHSYYEDALGDVEDLSQYTSDEDFHRKARSMDLWRIPVSI